MVLLLSGVGVAFYILTAMVTAIIEGDLRQLFGSRRMKVTIARLEDHYIVCGYGRVGEEIARELEERRVPFVVVDTNPAKVEVARDAGYLVVQGDATSEETLTEARIGHCRAVIAASDSDATNTYITLTAKALRDDVFVVTRISTPAVEKKLRQAGADRIVSPYSIGGRRMALAAIQPIMTEFIDVLPGDPSSDRILAEFAIDESSGLADKELGEALARCQDVIALAIRDPDGKLIVGPAASTRLAPGDTLIVVGDEDELRRIGVEASRQSA
jgi:voltage-gated potassium channel